MIIGWFINFISECILKVYDLIRNNKIRMLLLLVLEITSLAFEVGKNKNNRRCVLAVFLLSLFGCLVTICPLIISRIFHTATRFQTDFQLFAVESIFSVLQFVYALIKLTRPKYTNLPSLFTVVLAAIGFVFVLIKGEKVTTDSTRNPLQKITVCMPNIGIRRDMNLTMFTCYENLYKEVGKMFNIEEELRRKWLLVYNDDVNGVITVGHEPWGKFCKVVRKIYIYESKNLR